jgi:hypothetical protein
MASSPQWSAPVSGSSNGGGVVVVGVGRGVVMTVVDCVGTDVVVVGLTTVVLVVVDGLGSVVLVVVLVVAGVVVVDATGGEHAKTVSVHTVSSFHRESTVIVQTCGRVWSGEAMLNASGAPNVTMVSVRTTRPLSVVVTTVSVSPRGMLNATPSQSASAVFALA